mmetsp:Transcript_17100/g.66596  ORF Transcript_17100/g.66596 Transcript_17100/m.66596 type:complete len:286 (+) Transcript_17100:100-957(+)
MSNHEARAQRLLQEAEKKKKGGFFSGAKWDEAAELIVKAASMYKLAKKWERAGELYIEAAECQMKINYGHDAASNYINASNMFKKAKSPRAIECLQAGVAYYTEEGRFSIAAKYQKEIAEHYEAENDLENAIEAYESAADFYEGEGSTTSSNQCKLQVATYCGQLERYEKAIEIFEAVAKESLGNKLLKYSAKDYFLKAGLMRLCADAVGAKVAIEKYQDLDYTFGSTRECSFLVALLAAIEEFDVEAFTNAVVEFDSIQKLDNWKTTVLLRIKNTLKEDDPSLC